MGVLKFERSIASHQSKLLLSSTKFPCPNYNAAEGLKVNDKRVFMTSSHAEINELMLNPFLFPRCLPKNYQLTKCHVSPYSSGNSDLPPIIARLSYHGSLDLSKYVNDHDSREIGLESFAELCEIRKTFFDLPSSYGKLNKVKEILKELTFNNFEWCPEIIDSHRFIAAVTKSNEIIFNSISISNEISVMHSEKFDGIISSIKWIVNHDAHMLLVANAKGNLVPLVLQLSEDRKSLSVLKKDELVGELKLPISHMVAERVDGTLTILCAKAHSLEIFHISNNIVKSIVRYIGLSITGVVKIKHESLEFLLTTLNNKVSYIKLESNSKGLKILDFQKVDNTIGPMQASRYSAYGITASRNNVLIFSALYPQMVRENDIQYTCATN